MAEHGTNMKAKALKMIEGRIKQYSEDRNKAFRDEKMIKYAALGMLIDELSVLWREIANL